MCLYNSELDIELEGIIDAHEFNLGAALPNVSLGDETILSNINTVFKKPHNGPVQGSLIMSAVVPITDNTTTLQCSGVFGEHPGKSYVQLECDDVIANVLKQPYITLNHVNYRVERNATSGLPSTIFGGIATVGVGERDIELEAHFNEMHTNEEQSVFYGTAPTLHVDSVVSLIRAMSHSAGMTSSTSLMFPPVLNDAQLSNVRLSVALIEGLFIEIPGTGDVVDTPEGLHIHANMNVFGETGVGFKVSTMLDAEHVPSSATLNVYLESPLDFGPLKISKGTADPDINGPPRIFANLLFSHGVAMGDIELNIHGAMKILGIGADVEMSVQSDSDFSASGSGSISGFDIDFTVFRNGELGGAAGTTTVSGEFRGDGLVQELLTRVNNLADVATSEYERLTTQLKSDEDKAHAQRNDVRSQHNARASHVVETIADLQDKMQSLKHLQHEIVKHCPTVCSDLCVPQPCGVWCVDDCSLSMPAPQCLLENYSRIPCAEFTEERQKQLTDAQEVVLSSLNALNSVTKLLANSESLYDEAEGAFRDVVRASHVFLVQFGGAFSAVLQEVGGSISGAFDIENIKFEMPAQTSAPNSIPATLDVVVMGQSQTFSMDIALNDLDTAAVKLLDLLFIDKGIGTTAKTLKSYHDSDINVIIQEALEAHKETNRCEVYGSILPVPWTKHSGSTKCTSSLEKPQCACDWNRDRHQCEATWIDHNDFEEWKQECLNFEALFAHSLQRVRDLFVHNPRTLSLHPLSPVESLQALDVALVALKIHARHSTGHMEDRNQCMQYGDVSIGTQPCQHNVAQQLFLPHHGRLMNGAAKMCLTAAIGGTELSIDAVTLEECAAHEQSELRERQRFSVHEDQVRYGQNKCLQPSDEGLQSFVALPCKPDMEYAVHIEHKQRFKFLLHIDGKCLKWDGDGKMATLGNCEMGLGKMFFFEHHRIHSFANPESCLFAMARNSQTLRFGSCSGQQSKWLRTGNTLENEKFEGYCASTDSRK